MSRLKKSDGREWPSNGQVTTVRVSNDDKATPRMATMTLVGRQAASHGAC
jgi:hypothetical protein